MRRHQFLSNIQIRVPYVYKKMHFNKNDGQKAVKFKA